jgi:CubicO group peptidase (beta-lactamase class C family)
MAAQHLVEMFSKQDLPSFVASRILAPLNMTSTSFSLRTAQETGRLSEFFQNRRRIPAWFREDDVALMGGAGGVLSTAEDLLQWGKLFLGALGSASVPPEILDECMRPQADVGGGVTYGFGWFQQKALGADVRRPPPPSAHDSHRRLSSSSIPGASQASPRRSCCCPRTRRPSCSSRTQAERRSRTTSC